MGSEITSELIQGSIQTYFFIRMKTTNFLTLLIICLFLSIKNTGAQTPDSVKAYIDSALYFMQSKSLNGKNLDWSLIRDSAYQKASGAKNYTEAFPSIVYAFQQLKDYHGMVANHDTFYRYPPPIDFEKVLSRGIKKEFLKGNRIVTTFINNSIAYLRVPTMNVTSQDAMNERANNLRDSLCKLLKKNPKGMIIDLRMNTGGNSAPMISGLGPLFQFSLLGYGVDRDGKLLGGVQIKDGVLLDEKGDKMVDVKTTCQVSKPYPIALLIGSSTISSGEILAVYLKQQPNVKTFGETTPGFCNATEGFLFMNNQGYLLLSVNMVADAKKHVYADMRVHPDVYIHSEDNYDDLEADPTIKAALKWLIKNRQESTVAF
jgi:hypothetical protein